MTLNEAVTYAEAITMCLRVLGYANEIDSKGTWPTNYIAKAQDLKLMKDLEYKSYNDGAQRGNVALLIWNMLRTEMWEVRSESEGDGLVSAPWREMIDVKFSDYTYDDDAEFVGFSIEKDSKNDTAKVVMTLNSDELSKADWEYAGNDFYKFVPGTEVEVLVNDEEGILLTIVPTGDDTLIEGTKEEVDEKYDELLDVDYVYAYGRVESKKIVDNVTLSTLSEFVDKVEIKDKSVKVNKTTRDDSDWDYYLILKDGERAELRDLKEGDILTAVTVSYDGDEVDTFYVIGGSEEEGKLTRYVIENYDDSDVEYVQITVSNKEYKLDKGATYVEDPDKDNVTSVKFYNTGYDTKMKGEEVTLRLDPIFGNVVRVEFDGKIDGGEESTDIHFFGIVSTVERESSKTYTVTLVNEDGEEEYTFAKGNGVSIAKEMYDSEVEGVFAVFTINDDNEIEDVEFIAMASPEGDSSRTTATEDESQVFYGDSNTEYYGYKLVEGAKYDKDELAIMQGDTEVIDVDKSVVVVTLTYDDKGTSKDSDDECMVEFSEGLDGISKLKDEDIIIVYDADETYITAKYVVLFDNISTKSDNKVAKVVSYRENKIGQMEVKLKTSDDETEIVIDKDNLGLAEDQEVIVYTTKENSDGDLILTLVSRIDVAEDDLTYILSGNGRKATTNLDTINLDKASWKDEYEEYTVILVDVSATDNGDFDEIDSISTIDYEDISFEDFDRYSIDTTNEVFYIVRGLGEID